MEILFKTIFFMANLQILFLILQQQVVKILKILEITLAYLHMIILLRIPNIKIHYH